MNENHRMNFLHKRLTALTATVLLVSPACKKAPETSARVDTSAIVLFAVGQVKAAGQDLKVGSFLKDGQVVSIGSKSMGDLQYRESNSGVTVRLRENTEYEVSGRRYREAVTFTGKIRKGSGLFQVTKLDGSEGVQIMSPTAIAAVRGTKFEVVVNEQGETSLTVFDGKVTVRKRLPVVEDLPPEVIESSKTLQGLVSTMEQKSVVLESGHSIKVEKVQESEVPGIEAIKKATAELSGPVSPEQARKIAESIDRAVQEPGKADGLKKSVEDLPPPVVSNVRFTDEQMKLKLQEYDEIVAVAKTTITADTNLDEALRRRNQEKREQLESRIEQVFQKSAETLVLKNGQRIRGVILEDAGKYTALTVEGPVEVPKDQVESVEF